MEDELKRIRNKRKVKPEKHKCKLSLLLLITIIGLAYGIIDKKKININDLIKKIPVSTINTYYEKYLGSVLPINNKEVFDEEIKYNKISDYKDGALLEVDNNETITALQSGLIVFIGEKEGYGNCVIVQGIDNVDIIYGNITDLDVKLYDYISKSETIGKVKDNKLYLVFKKEGNILKYDSYL